MIPGLTGYEPCATTDPDLFFPDKADWTASRVAKTLCADCHVVDACLQHALRHEEYGVWGGTTGTERRELRRRLNILYQPLDPYNGMVRRAS